MPKKAVSVHNLLKKKFLEMPVEGEWMSLLGKPAVNGVWHIKGESGQGKTTLLMQLAKYLTKFGVVAYNSLEEGTRKSMQDCIRENRMHEVTGRFYLLDREMITDLIVRLKKRNAPDIVIIDSIQFSDLTKSLYKRLVSEFPDKLFIFNSHAEGKKSIGAIARDVEFDADIKIYVEGYLAFSRSRMSRGVVTKPYVIWDDGAKKYWGNKHGL